MRALIVFLLLGGVWAVWSGHYSLKPLIFSFGVLSCLLVTWFVVRMDHLAQDLPGDLPGFAVLLRAPRFAVYLLVATVSANLHVARLILDPAMPISPRLLRYQATQESAWAQVVHANSITLTPGTVTLDLREGELLIHALGPVSSESVVSGEIDREVSILEGTIQRGSRP